MLCRTTCSLLARCRTPSSPRPPRQMPQRHRPRPSMDRPRHRPRARLSLRWGQGCAWDPSHENGAGFGDWAIANSRMLRCGGSNVIHAAPLLHSMLPVQAAPATKGLPTGVSQAAIPPEVAIASISTAALPETPSRPQSPYLVQSLASRSTHRHEGWGCFGMFDGMKCHIKCKGQLLICQN